MIYESQNQQPAVNVYPNGNGGMYGGDAFGGNGAWWIIILFLFAMFGGWGNNGANASGNGIAYVPYGMPMGGQNYVQQGFDQAAIMGGLNGIQTTVANGFANAEVSRCNSQANLLATLNANQNTNTAAMNGLAMSLQNCCCENRAATADLKYTVATEACSDRAAVTSALQEVTAQNNANTQRILDMMCQNTIDAKNEKIANLQSQLQMAQLQASQNAQTAQILTDNLAQTNALEQYLAPVPRPAYVVQNPNCCATNYYNGCGCSAS
jgi:hypothetical protein